MVKRSFTVRALWDDEAKVYYSESDIIGLHIETDSLDEFESLIQEIAPGLIVANHLSKTDLTKASLVDLIPAILWQRPAKQHAIA